MKVLQINTTFRNGGSTGRISYDLMQTQRNEGVSPFVVYGYETGTESMTNTFCLQGCWRRRINILRTRLFDHHGFYNEAETEKLIVLMEEIKPDIIHLHNIHNHFVHVGRLFEYIKSHRIPVIWTLHDCWSFTGHCAYFDYAHCNKWKTGCHHCPSIRDYPPTWFFDRSSRNYRDKKNAFCGVEKLVLVTPSRWLADLTRNSYLKDYPVRVINNGVDTTVFKPVTENPVRERLGIGNKKVLLAMASGFGIRKGGEYLKRIPEMLHEDEVLLLVGKGANAQASLHPDKCVGIEYTNNIHELAEYYSTADVFVNPTLEDNFPTTNIEAMACGTPVVTFHTGGSVESVLDDENVVENGKMQNSSVGIVVPQGNLELLLQAAREIINRGGDAYEEACRSKAEKRYNKNQQFLQYIDLYRKIIK